VLRFCGWLRERPLLVIPLFLGLYGYGTIDVGDYRVLSAAPLALHPELSRQFLQFSPLAYFLGYPFTSTIGWTWSFAIVMGGGLVGFVTALRHFAAVRYRAHRHDAMLMILATPLLIVLTQYLGKSDLYLVVFLLLLVASGNPVRQVAFSALIVLCHLEMGLLILVSAMFLGIVPWRSAIAGGVVGVLLILGYHQYLLPSPPRSRADMGAGFLSEALDAVMNTPVLHLVFTFGAFWMCVFTAWPLGWRWRAVFVGTLAIASVTLDFTRVFNLVGLPMTIAAVDKVFPPVDDGAGPGAPRWFVALPLLAFVQVHLLSGYVFDSRMPALVGRLLASVGGLN
jgi:hypothetical protein